jgi:hypothetical protein
VAEWAHEPDEWGRLARPITGSLGRDPDEPRQPPP